MCSSDLFGTTFDFSAAFFLLCGIAIDLLLRYVSASRSHALVSRLVGRPALILICAERAVDSSVLRDAFARILMTGEKRMKERDIKLVCELQ